MSKEKKNTRAQILRYFRSERRIRSEKNLKDVKANHSKKRKVNTSIFMNFDFRNESNGIFVFAVIFFSDKFRLLTLPILTEFFSVQKVLFT